MNSQHKRIRAQLSSMAPKRAVAYVLSFKLPQDEAACIIECDVRRKSCVQVADMLHVSVDGLAKIRRRAYTKIADGQEKSTD
nr:MAG TPA: ECF sigma factor [Caudoviricetes sp.]